jgi:uncharacterized membrane protein
MSATFVPTNWPLATRTRRVFGRRLTGQAAQGQPDAVQWLLRRNCSLTPQQLGSAYLALCAISSLVAGLFFWQGVPFVAAFAGLELVAVGVAMLLFARHAADRESLTLVGGSLLIEQWVGPRVERTHLPTDWLTIEPAGGQGSLVQITGRGRTVCVGRHLRPELRAEFADELRLALRQPGHHGDNLNDPN